MIFSGGRTLRRTLVLSALLVVGIAAVAVVAAISLMLSQRDALERSADASRTEQRIAEQIVALTFEQQLDAYRYLEQGDSTHLVAFRDRGERAYGQIRQYLIHELSTESRLQVEQIKAAHEQFEVAAFRAFDLLARGQPAAARRRLADLDERAAALAGAMDRFLEARAGQRERFRSSQEVSARRLRVALAVAALVLFALVILLGLRLRRHVLRPLDDLMAATRRLGGGDLDARVPTRRRYVEFDEVAAGFNQMADNVQVARETMEAQNEEIRQTLDHLQETQAELVQHEKLSAMGQMLAGLAHELNNPLAGVLGMAQVIRTQLAASPDEEARRMSETLATPLEREALRARSLVRNLLNFARRPSDVVEPVDVAAAVGTALGLCGHAFAQAGKSVRVAVPPNLRVMADAQKLQHAIVNVINNALDAVVESGGQGLTIAAAAEGHGIVRVDFDDDGTGFKNPSAALVPFYTTKPVGKGTGLGLSLVGQFVNEFGGTVTVSNRPEGGARVSLLLIAVVGNVAARRATPGPMAAMDLPTGEGAAEVARPRVLVVDDEPTLRLVQRHLLTSIGADSVVVSSGREARDTLLRESFDLVISDLRMPGEMDGRDLLIWLKRERPLLAESALLLTGDVSGMAAAPLPVPMERVLQKPFTSAEYVSRVRQALGR